MSEDWTEKARSRIAAGESVAQVARSLSVSRTTLRRKLGIAVNGAGASEPVDIPAHDPSKITLPRISIPMLSDEDVRPRAKLAPIPRVAENPGAERYRAVRQRMIREGKITEPSVIEEFRP